MRLLAALSLAWCAACVSGPNPSTDIVVVERLRFAAMTRQDVNALEPMLGEDLVYCHSDGRCETKPEFLETIRSGRIRYRAINVIELRTRRVGEAVVINGSVLVDGVIGGQPRSLRIAFTDVYARRNGRWQLIAWQSTRLP
ncbi:MAG: nuclear transport factor 2 family protein [Steroidobacteraceae bacterium]